MFGKIVNALLNRKSPKATQPSQAGLSLSFAEYGITFTSSLNTSYWYFEPEKHEQWQAVALLAQWLESGYAVLDESNSIMVSWQHWYELTMVNEDYKGSDQFFRLPPASPLRLKLSAHGTFSDADFCLITEWQLNGRALSIPLIRQGGFLQEKDFTYMHFSLSNGGGGIVMPIEYLLSAQYWQLLEAIDAFPKSDSSLSSREQQLIFEKAWGRVRKLALLAQAEMSPTLRNYHVITADELDIKLIQHGEDLDDIEIQPVIEGTNQQEWLKSFDGHWFAQQAYTWVNEQNEAIKVVVAEDALEVLNTIRKMPERRVKGELAERFLRNPAHVLGDTAERVLPAERFEQARTRAGIIFISFSCRLLRDKETHDATSVMLDFRDDSLEADTVYEPLLLPKKSEVTAFTEKLGDALKKQSVFFKWQHLSLSCDDTDHWHGVLTRWLTEERWSDDARIDLSELYDLSKYYERVMGIGEHKPQTTPYIAKTEKGGWVPEILISTIPTGDITVVSAEITKKMKEFVESNPVDDAVFSHPLLQPMSVVEVKALLKLEKEDKSTIAEKDGTLVTNSMKVKVIRQVLQIYQNIAEDEYAEWRDKVGKANQSAKLPLSLRSGINLKDHQHQGVAALQHLFASRTTKGIRGALMADDMGLGKTLQLLTFLIRYFEDNQNQFKPALVVAPVSLLENWRDEVAKFFDVPDNWLVSLYGDEVGKQRKRLNDEERNAHKPDKDGKSVAPGKLLPKKWLGDDTRIVLTTYETLRDYEFSLGLIDWSVMVCDEAQKIKTPGAQVTHAAKAMKADFRIACTGTPVENSLADLWCLFDYIQPGLLGSLSEFYKTYRKPIENKTPEQEAKTEQLRSLVDVQTIRRLKEEVAKDLPAKIEVESCLSLPLSDYQRGLYQEAANWYQAQENKKGAALAILHRLRGICAEPVPRINNEQKVFEKPLDEHLAHSPKMRWLLSTLDKIRVTGEKAIIFTEFKDMQRIIQRRVKERFSCSAHIINGETAVSVGAGKSTRQQMINRFQQHKGFDVLILSPVAVGYGVNIQAANHVIHFTRTWNPAKEDQATDRAYRIGQEKTVYVYYPTIISPEFETFEAKLHTLISKKRDLGKDMLNGVGELSVAEVAEGLATPAGEVINVSQKVMPEDLSSINAANFEKLISELLKQQGYQSEVVGRAGDHGVDVWAVKGNSGYLVQCKSTSKESGIGIEGINEVVGGAAHYRAKDKETQFTLVVATNGRFNKTAIVHANNQPETVELWDCDYLAAKVDECAVYL